MSRNLCGVRVGGRCCPRVAVLQLSSQLCPQLHRMAAATHGCVGMGAAAPGAVVEQEAVFSTDCWALQHFDLDHRSRLN